MGPEILILETIDSNNNLVALTDANDDITRFTYDPQTNQLDRIIAPTGLNTTFWWETLGNMQIPHVTRIQTYDPYSKTVLSTNELILDPYNDGHNFLGHGVYDTPEDMFTIGGDYIYTTKLSNTHGTDVFFTYNTAHQRTQQTTITAGPAGNMATEHTLIYEYPGTYNGTVWPSALLPPNHTTPLATTNVYTNLTTNQTRRTYETTTYDARGRLTMRNNPDGTTTTYEYDKTFNESLRQRFRLAPGLVTEQTTRPTTGTGPANRTTYQLAHDHLSVASATTYITEPDVIAAVKQTEDTTYNNRWRVALVGTSSPRSWYPFSG
jgi:YD repeat-containing protein